MALVVLKAKDVVVGDVVLCPDIGCWAPVGSVESTDDKSIIAFSGGPPATIGLVVEHDRPLTVRRSLMAVRGGSDTFVPVTRNVNAGRQQPQSRRRG
jgi:hypothetical protein